MRINLNVRNIVDSMTYDEFLERLRIEFGDFIRFAESGKTVRYQGLKARKASMALRKLLKVYRPLSIAQERKINNVYQEARKSIDDL